MRQCPKCGYKDLLEWKNLPHQLYHEYMTWEDFKRLYPKLAEELERVVVAKQKGNMVNGQDGHGYHLTRQRKHGRWVHRTLIELCLKGKWFSGSSVYEKPKPPNQKRLFEEKEKGEGRGD
jgi:hypothetical protein